MIRKIGALFLCAALLFGATACSATHKSTADGSGKIRVVVTFDALNEFVRAVGGDRVSISTIIPDGTEPHDFEPKPKDLAGIRGAAVFVYNGLGMENWASKAVQAAKNPQLVAVEASEGATAIGGGTTDSQPDPHLWLSLKGAELEAGNIRDGLIRADPSGAQEYRANCDRFTAQLEALFQAYQAKFEKAPRRDFVTGHAAFGYLCRDFGLTQHSVEDVFADGEPSPRQLETLITYCRKNAVHTIFAEEMVSPAISQTLASSVGAKVVPIYTMESRESGKTYLARMQSNLEKIDASLQ